MFLKEKNGYRPLKTGNMSHVGAGYVLAAIASILFSIKGIFVKLAYGHYSGPSPDMQSLALNLLFLRMVFAMPFYVLIGVWAWQQARREKKDLPDWRSLGSAALTGALGYYFSSYLDFQGLVYLTAQFERIIIYTSYPLFVILTGFLFFGGRIFFWSIGALLISCSGIILIFFEGAIAKGDNTSLGVILVLASAFFFALYQLLAKSIISRMGSLIFTCVAMAGACMGTIAHFLISQSTAHSPMASLNALPSGFIWIAAAIAFFCTLLPSFLLNRALETIGAQAVAIIGTLSPASTILIAMVLLGEAFTWTDGTGTVLVMTGVLLFTVYDAKQKLENAHRNDPDQPG